MPQLNPLVLKDAATTPLDHTFNPRGIDNGVATLVESSGVPIGDSRLSFAQSRNANGRIRNTIKLARPIVQNAVVAGVTRPTVVRTLYADLVFNFDESSTISERADVVKFVREILDPTKTMVKGYLVDLEGIY